MTSRTTSEKICLAVNKRAAYDYSINETFTAGVVLYGNEIKSLRERKVSINSSFCFFKKNELFIHNMSIARYDKIFLCSTYDEKRDRKLLLNKSELVKISRQVQKNMAVIPIKVFINKKGLAKIDIALVKGKKKYDKRQCLKERDIQRRKMWKGSF